MRIYNRYIITLALVAGIINSLLTFWEQNDLEIYFVVNVIAYLVITLLYVYLNPRARVALSGISMVLVGGFMVIVAIKVAEVVSGK